MVIASFFFVTKTQSSVVVFVFFFLILSEMLHGTIEVRFGQSLHHRWIRWQFRGIFVASRCTCSDDATKLLGSCCCLHPPHFWDGLSRLRKGSTAQRGYGNDFSRALWEGGVPCGERCGSCNAVNAIVRATLLAALHSMGPKTKLNTWKTLHTNTQTTLGECTLHWWHTGVRESNSRKGHQILHPQFN